ncbi:hypothetical protein [Paenibacillus sp. KR2-11]|uniref:hypothetical protein n=1 Tax=Paenibacillus sp. KR2-11 TaxID=3385500 RepID=UPI0038FD052D
MGKGTNTKHYYCLDEIQKGLNKVFAEILGDTSERTLADNDGTEEVTTAEAIHLGELSEGLRMSKAMNAYLNGLKSSVVKPTPHCLMEKHADHQ